jgi:hypothetical protein
VNNTDFSKQTDIRSESELVQHFRQLVDTDPDLQWQVPPESGQAPLPWVEVRLDDRSERFKPLYLLKPSIPELESRIDSWNALNRPLLVVPELSTRLLDVSRQKRLAAIDLNGRAYIRVPGMLVDRPPLPGRSFRFLLEPRNVFAGISARIVRTLLTDRDRIWTQRDLLHRTEASSGLVSRIVQHLLNQGFLEKKSSREFRLREPFPLLDAWAKADTFARRVRTIRYTVFATNLHGLARELHAWAQEQSVRIAFTQWLAAWLRQPYTEPVIASAYIDRLPEPAALQRLGLRPVEDAGKVWLHIPDEDGPLLETQLVQNLPLATDAQIYLDLQQTGLRGPDQAAALRNWEGFCRP